MTHITSLRRILLFLKPSGHWKPLLTQQGSVFSTNAEKGKFTGQSQCYPLRGTGLFRHDCFRFVDKQKNLIGDVYVFFNLHDEKIDTLYIRPRKKSGGIDFYRNDPKNTPPFLCWVPVPLPFANQSDEKIYIVINHPEDACGKIKIGEDAEFDTEKFAVHEWKTNGKWSPKQYSPQHNDIFLTGGQSSWCQELFAYDTKMQSINLFETFFV